MDNPVADGFYSGEGGETLIGTVELFELLKQPANSLLVIGNHPCGFRAWISLDLKFKNRPAAYAFYRSSYKNSIWWDIVT
jgi:hypothetical protein